MIKEYNIEEFVPISSIAKQAALDTYADFEKEQARYMAWSIRGLKKLVRQTLRTGKRYAILNVNKNLRNAILPCDFKEEFYVGFIDSCGKKVALTPDNNIINTKLIEDVPCENECDKGCGCYPKQLCQDLQTTQVINKIRINDTDYDETVTSTLQPNGEYYVVTTTPYLDTEGEGVIYRTTKEFVTQFDVADCGCIERTERNNCRLENLCYDQYCCYCTGCSNSGNTDFGGYRIFKDNNTIQFDMGMTFDKVYMEYRGFLPKSGNEYLVPEVASETLINFTKFKSIENKKGVSASDRVWYWDRYKIELENMRKVLGRMTLDSIIHSALLVPAFDYNGRNCYTPCAFSGSSMRAVVNNNSSNNTTIIVQESNNTGNCNPSIITTNGQEMEGGTKYHNIDLVGVPFRVFANPFNRYLRSDEYNVLLTGGFEILTGVYTLVDEFDIFPKWCDVNAADIPATVAVGVRKLVVKVDGNPGSPVADEYTYYSSDLIGAVCEDIIINKTLETVIDGDFIHDPVTGIITRTNKWFPDDTGIINYIK